MTPTVKIDTDELPVTVRNGRLYLGVGAIAVIAAGSMAWAHAEAKSSDHERRLTTVEATLEQAATKDDIRRVEATQQQILNVLMNGRK